MRGAVDYGVAYADDLDDYLLDDEQPPHGRGWKIVQWVSLALAGVLVVGSLGAYATYRKFLGNIAHVDESGRTPEDKRPPKLNSAMNILIMGSDTREGANKKYGSHTDGERSDTTILLHLSAGGERAVGISFPRDLMVNIPSCTYKGKTVGANYGQINSAFAYGGPVCTVNTIENITKIRIDHFMKVDFTGFKSIVNALGGVEICSPKAFTDRQAKLTIRKAGRQTINGETALGWVRTRYKLGDGSDLGRIQRQQQFMSSVIRKATSQGVLTNPVKLTKFVNAATKSLATDKAFDQGAIMDLANKLKGIDLRKIEFKTVPWRWATAAERLAHPDYAARVFFQEDAAEQLFEAVRQDNKAPAPKPADKTTKQAPQLPAETIKVKVYNGTTQSGLAGRTVTGLAAKKYQAVLGSNESYQDGALARTMVQYGPGGEKQAAQVAALVPGAKVSAAAQGAPGTVYLFLGADFTGLSAAGPVAIPKVKGQVNAADSICKRSALE